MEPLALTLLLIALLQPAAEALPQQPAAPRPRRQAAAPARVTVEVQVATESGAPIPDVQITAQGPLFRAGRSDTSGRLTLSGLTPGTYRLRAEGDGVVTLEKELNVKPGAPMSVDFALAAAPPPPAPPPPPPPPAPPEATPADVPVGEPRMAFLPELAERSLGGRDPVRTVALGCSGLNRSDLLVVREGTGDTSHTDVDLTFYVIAGEAKLTLAGKEQVMAPGWFGLVPRGSSYTLVRRGRNPAIVLAVVAGVPCTGSRPTP